MEWLPRLINIWTGDDVVELHMMLEDFRIDFAYDMEFVDATYIVDELLQAGDYELAAELFERMAPLSMLEEDYQLFLDILFNAQF